MKKTIQEIKKELQEKEKLSLNVLAHVKGGDGCDDKRKEVGRNNSSGSWTGDGTYDSNGNWIPNGTYDPNGWH
jgi:hypothetical protein